MPEQNADRGEIRESLDLIQRAIIALDKKIDAQGKRLELLEQSKGSSMNAESPLQEKTFKDEANFPESAIGEIKESWIRNTQPVENSDSSITFSSKDSNASLEENIGGKWFARIGLAALFLGVSFFLKYAFDNNWIGEGGRVMVGVLIGFILLGVGGKTIRKYSLYGQAMLGGGIGVLYLSIFSAYNFYGIIDSFTAFFVMILITVGGIGLSLRYDALSLMMVSTIGGFLTPLMASSGQNNQVGLLSYVVLLDVAILAISVFKKWRPINVVGFLGTIILFAGWGAKFYTRQDLDSTMFFLTLFFIIYSVSSLIYNLVKKELSTGVEQMLTLFSAVLYFSASYALLNKEFHIFMGFLALVLAVYYILWAFAVRNFTSEDENLYGFLAFLAVGFVTLAIPIQFEQNVITIGWAIEAVMLMIIGTKLKKSPIIKFSVVVSALTLMRYLFLDTAKYGQHTLAVFNSIFFTAIVIIMAGYVIAYIANVFLEDDIPGIKKGTLIALFVLAANFVTIFSISTEIAQSYERDIQVLYSAQNAAMQQRLDASSRTFYYDSYNLNQDKISSLRNKSSISLSIFWIVYAIALLVVGMAGKYKGVRLGGLALLMLAIFKLFFIDLWSLGTLYRIISSMSLGIVLLVISFMYQKYKGLIREMI